MTYVGEWRVEHGSVTMGLVTLLTRNPIALLKPGF